MKSSEGAAGNKSYLFNVDLLIDGESNAQALELLLRLLNDASVSDYRIHAGRQMGRLIQQALDDPAEHKSVHIPRNLQTRTASNAESGAEPQRATKPAAKPETKAADSKAAKTDAKKAPASSPDIQDQASARIRNYITGNKLIRLAVNKGRGVKLSVPCRILSYDEEGHSVTVYHVDEKQVYTFSLNEIDDFQE